MSDDRYEIRSKISQGGVGAVYRAFDRHLKREVAIKRVLPEGGYENQEEATKAMLNEAASLCSVQHPHIVTVFDAGVDNDGPYVVMELLSGRTIDEMIERGTLTFEDFREVAVQSQEALIAAQDLDLVHRDIKPTNVMVTWLPSGRFQVKIVDFGLAKFSPKPSLQTIDHGDSVFGSIHFMAPEQFERTPLDKRTDMYSMGCVYYYCLAGQYPFDGETAPQVMNAHLQHSVTPIEQLRPDLPDWLCKWVMWHLARRMEDRPADAREALKLFLMSENAPVEAQATNPTLANAPDSLAQGAVGGTLQTPTGPVNTPTAPQPILPPESQGPSIHTAAQAVKSTGIVPTAPGATGTGPVETTPAPSDNEKDGNSYSSADSTEEKSAPAEEETPKVEAKPAAAKLIVGAAAAAPAQPSAEATPAANTPEPAAPAPVAPVAQTPPAPAAAPAPTVTPPAGKPLLVTGAAGVNLATPGAASPATPVPSAPGTAAAATVAQGAVAPVAGAAPAGAPLAAPLAGTPGTPPAPTPGLGGPDSPDGTGVALPPQKGGLSNTAKGVIAALLAVVIIIAALVLWAKKQNNDDAALLNNVTELFNDPANPPKEVPMDGETLDVLLDTITTLGATDEKQRPTLQQALYIAKATDDTDIDARIAEYAVMDDLDNGLREDLFEVLGARANPSSLDRLIEFASKTTESDAGRAALRATTKMVTKDNFDSLLAIIVRTKDSSIKNAAVDSLSVAIKKSEDPGAYSQSIVLNHKNAPDEGAKMALLRLAGSAGGDDVAALVDEALKGENDLMKAAAINALQNWPDDSQFETLLDYTGKESNSALRRTGFSGLIKFLKDGPELDEDTRSILWGDIAGIATGTSEQMEIVNAMVRESGDWADDILDTFVEHGDTDDVKFGAERAKEIFAENRKRAERGGATEEDE